MKRVTLLILLFSLGIAGCAQNSPAPVAVDALTISGAEQEISYTLDSLQNLPSTQASFQGVTYQGVALSTLLQEAGFDLQNVKAVKAIASDGFSANYGPDLFNKPDTLVAYARANGPLVEDEAPLRMVLPDQEGKLNPRQLTKIEVIQ
ncbi:MAG: molybdopterin-dependent oxidoreductase [Anaerolineales bacterium]|jgi:hypothetical protein